MTSNEQDWNKVKEHFDYVLESYKELVGVPGVNVSFALMLTFDPLLKRYNSGERTQELYDEMVAVQ